MTLRIVRRLIPEWGTTYGPAGDGPFPAIMLLHGSEGGLSGWNHRNAVLLAAHGFLAFPFSYSKGGNAWNAGNITDVPVDRTMEALRALRSFEFSRPKVAVFGTSRGGEHALLLTALMVRDEEHGVPDAVATLSAADVVCGAFDARKYRDFGEPGYKAWDPAERAWSWKETSDGLMPTTPIEIERYDGPVFLAHGVKDTVWSSTMTERLAERMRAAGRDPEVHLYDGQGHLPDSEGENQFNADLIDFLERTLCT